MLSNSIYQYLKWDSEFFGIRVGRVNISSLTTSLIEEIINWQMAEEIDCIYFLAEVGDISTIRNVQRFNFDFTGVRVVLNREFEDSDIIKVIYKPDAVIRPSTSADFERLKPITVDSYKDSRFYMDGRFPKAKCEMLYEIWLRKSIEENYADIVWVVELDGIAAGFVTCKVDKINMIGEIGLMGINKEFRGKGLGEWLINTSLNWFKQQGCKSVEVVTQGSNIAAQRLYQSCGFKTKSIQLWFHRWLKSDKFDSKK